MSKIEVESNIREQPVDGPRARDWFWRPWYAKLWIAAIVATLFLGSWLPRGSMLGHGDLMLFVGATVLNPYLFVGLLGAGFFRAAWLHKFPSRYPDEHESWEVHDSWPRYDPDDPRDPDWERRRRERLRNLH